MTRGMVGRWRPVAVWTVVSGAAATAASAAPGAWRAAGASGASDAVADGLVAACATGLALALAWLWVITTATVAGLLAGRGAGRGGATRRLVLAACGVAVLAGAAAPASASRGDGAELLVGLALPERAVAPPTAHAPSRALLALRQETYVVRAGDSLWSIAETHRAAAEPVEQRWRDIWQANRDVVGDDPDLILPGQALRLPTTRTTPPPHSDGDR